MYSRSYIITQWPLEDTIPDFWRYVLGCIAPGYTHRYTQRHTQTHRHIHTQTQTQTQTYAHTHTHTHVRIIQCYWTNVKM